MHWLINQSRRTHPYCSTYTMSSVSDLGLSRFNTCVTLARLTPRWRASAARFSNLPESRSDR